MKRNKRGISLIVLVITIIVMIILAAAVMISLSNTGILNKANDAVDATNLKELEQIASLAWSEAYIDNMDVTDEAARLANIKAAVDKALENINTSGYDIVVSKRGVTVKKQGALEAGLYDDNGIMLASWDELVNDYGVDFSERPHYTVNSSTLLSNIISQNSELQAGTRLIISRGFDTIPNYVFYGSTSLTSVEIPVGVTSIGVESFENCTSLTNVKISNGVTIINSFAFNNCTSLTSIEIPDGVTEIRVSTFNNCTSLTSIKIPDSVTNLGGSAFNSCTSLTSVEIPAGVTSIGSSAFSNCTSLTSIRFAGTTEQWNAITFGDSWNTSVPAAQIQCTNGNLSNTDITYTLAYNGSYYYYICNGVNSGSPIGVVIQTQRDTSNYGVVSVTMIAANAFENQTALESVVIPATITNIGASAFSGCTSLSTITFLGTVEQWNAITFGDGWNTSVPATEVICTDGNVTL